jgi:ubiquitin-protein ligase
LIKDLEELEEQVDPSLGVSAQPLKNNLMKWHANIKGPEGSAYEGAVLHLEFAFPHDYPNSAPAIT